MKNEELKEMLSSGGSNLNDGLGHDGKHWPEAMDAKIWADEFCKRNRASDHASMIGWFANAIMVGYDTAKQTTEKSSDVDCLTCANRGKVNGMSEDTYCQSCKWSESWRTDNYVPN